MAEITILFVHSSVDWLVGLCRDGRFLCWSGLRSLLCLQSAGGPTEAGSAKTAPFIRLEDGTGYEHGLSLHMVSLP